MSDTSPQELLVDGACVAELLSEDPDLQLIDVREPYEREAGYIEGSRHLELTRLSAESIAIAPSSSTAVSARAPEWPPKRSVRRATRHTPSRGVW
jgi:rhodanese-related sulfurtransferase